MLHERLDSPNTPQNNVTGSAGNSPIRPTDRQRQATSGLGIVCAGTFLVLAAFAGAVSMVGPTAAALHSGSSGKAWILGGISLGLAIALLSLGVLADNVGRRRVFLWSLAGLSASSLWAALSPTIGFLVAGRILQGIAGAGVLAAGLGLIGNAFPSGAPRTHATGLWGATLGAGIAVGPVASAALGHPLGWRGIYWALAVFAAILLLPARGLSEGRAHEHKKFDLAGALLFALAMATLTAGLVLGRSGWGRPATLALIALSMVSLAGFVVAEVRSDTPLVDLSLLRSPLFVASITGAVFTGLGLIALMSLLPSVLQGELGLGTLASAWLLAIWSGMSTAVAFMARRLPARLGSSVRLAAGFALCAGGVFAMRGLPANARWEELVPGLVLAGVGSGLANAALGRLAVESVPLSAAAMGSGANNTARYVGGAAGIAVMVAIMSTGHAQSGETLVGWHHATNISAAICLTAAAVAATCGWLAHVKRTTA